MSLYESVSGLFAGVFGSYFPDAMLHLPVRAEDDGGTVTRAFTGDPGQDAGTLCKAQRDAVTREMREAQGYSEKDVRFLILTAYEGIELPEPTQGAQLTAPWPGGTRYSIEGEASLDAVASHWTVRARPVRSGAA